MLGNLVKTAAPALGLLAFAIGSAFASPERATGDSGHTPETTMTADMRGTLHLPALDVPLSSYMSEPAKKRFIEQALHPYAFDSSGSIKREREAVDNWYLPKVQRAKALYPVHIEHRTIAGVPVDVITPRSGVSAGNRERVLINLHGGAFRYGAGQGGLAESIPIAGTGKFQVISVDYRMAPEHTFPAASEDVAAVFKELLKRYKPENIGIYGCSAGAQLTAQSVAWFQKAGLPRPGAIGIFCVGADGSLAGDSWHFEGLLDVSWKLGALLHLQSHPGSSSGNYYDGADLTDPLLSPVVSPIVLSKFPPTLLISGTRDPGLSSVVHTHAQLSKAGIEADLHVWDGMGHNFLVEMDLPESMEAYEVIARFFAKHLGGAAR